MPEVIFPGPEGRLEGRFVPAPRPRAPVAMILHPHPSAGGTMNREAVVLGTPVWTTFAGTLGAVDRALIADGRLQQLTRVEDLVIAPRVPTAAPTLRDPALLVDLALNGLV